MALKGPSDTRPTENIERTLLPGRRGRRRRGNERGDEKSTDPGLSAAERKSLRSREAEEAIAEHESAQKAFHENRERLREERLRREEAAGPMLYPAPQLPDDTPVENVRFATRIRNALNAAGMKNDWRGA